MTKNSRGGDGGESAADLDAAISKLQRQTEALDRVKRARAHLLAQQSIARECLRRARANLDKAETEARECGAFALLPGTEPPP